MNAAGHILEAAIQIAEARGYMQITMANVAEKAGVSPSLVQYHYLTTAELKALVVREGLRRESYPIIVDALLHREEAALAISAKLKKKVCQWLCGK